MTSPLQQKLKIAGPVVVTANRLADGAVVYRTADGRWTTKLDQAAIARAAPAAAELLKAAQGEGLIAVGPYVAPVETQDGGVKPANLRESIRLNGPTIELPASFGI
jgi:Protein of unknown function (DUF2849)